MKTGTVDPFKRSPAPLPQGEQPTLYPDPSGRAGRPVATLEPLAPGEPISRERVERAMIQLGVVSRFR